MTGTLFISDLHLSPTTTAELACLQQLLQQAPLLQAEALYILGDFFEVWIGEDVDRDSWLQTLVEALQNASRHMKICFMPGNRDFLLNAAFARQCGATLLTDPTVIDLYGVPTVLLHGDSLCVHDKAYQRWRRIAHCRTLQRLFLALPQAWRQRIANALRQRSREYGQTLTPAQMDTPLEAVLACMQRYGVEQMIHGHIHQPLLQYFHHQQRWYRRFVLGDWQWRAQALWCKPAACRTLSLTSATTITYY